jgi:hypothetical protein
MNASPRAAILAEGKQHYQSAKFNSCCLVRLDGFLLRLHFSIVAKNSTRTLAPARSAGVTLIRRIDTDKSYKDL